MQIRSVDSPNVQLGLEFQCPDMISCSADMPLRMLVRTSRLLYTEDLPFTWPVVPFALCENLGVSIILPKERLIKLLDRFGS